MFGGGGLSWTREVEGAESVVIFVVPEGWKWASYGFVKGVD